MARFTNTNNFTASQQDVTTSGTPVNLTAAVVLHGTSLLVKAKAGNTGVITVGNSSANALNTGTSNFRLSQNQSIELEVNNVGLIWIDATVSGEGIEYIFESPET